MEQIFETRHSTTIQYYSIGNNSTQSIQLKSPPKKKKDKVELAGKKMSVYKNKRPITIHAPKIKFGSADRGYQKSPNTIHAPKIKFGRADR